MATQRSLSAPPLDGVTGVAWLSPSAVACASWDGTVAMHEVGSGGACARVGIHTAKGPLLCVARAGASAVYAGGLDMAVLRHEFGGGGRTAVLGSHTAAVRCVEHSAALGVAISGSWDKTAKVWDARTDGAAAATVSLPDRCYSLSLIGPNSLIVATASRHVVIYDLRKLVGAGAANPEAAVQSMRESALKHQTRIVRAFPDGSGFVTGSVEGRVAVDFVDSAMDGSKYAFKCHRVKRSDGGEDVYPVNALAFHPQHGTFATGGGDGLVCIWDAAAKKRITQLPSFGAPVSALEFSPDGALLAIATSAWDEGKGARTEGAPADTVHVRACATSEVLPKVRAPPTTGA